MKKIYLIKMQDGSERIYFAKQELAAGDHVVVENRHGYYCGVVVKELDKLPDGVSESAIRYINGTFDHAAGTKEAEKDEIAAKRARIKELLNEMQEIVDQNAGDILSELISLVDDNYAAKYEMVRQLREELPDGEDENDAVDDEDEDDGCCAGIGIIIHRHSCDCSRED